jgi:hypothetical protein
MAFTGWQGPLSGEGSFQLNGGAGVTPTAIDCSVDTITSPKVRVVGVTIPRRLLYAGSFGFSFVEDDAASISREFVVYSRQLDWEYMDLSIQDFLTNGNQATNLWYRLRDGVTFFLAGWYV